MASSLDSSAGLWLCIPRRCSIIDISSLRGLAAESLMSPPHRRLSGLWGVGRHPTADQTGDLTPTRPGDGDPRIGRERMAGYREGPTD